jgi:hypothetical protein
MGLVNTVDTDTKDFMGGEGSEEGNPTVDYEAFLASWGQSADQQNAQDTQVQ